jgi:hypothetical protein
MEVNYAKEGTFENDDVLTKNCYHWFHLGSVNWQRSEKWTQVF